MPSLLIEIPEQLMPLAPPRKKWTREECSALQATGLFERERLELIDGELISKMGKNRPHVVAFTLIHLWLLKAFGDRFVNAEAPIDVSSADNLRNEPVPDVIVLSRDFSLFRSNPQPADLKLVVEISDSSLAFDLKTKASLYARAGIVEYWVLDIAGHRLIVHRDPADGKYASVIAYAANESVSPVAAPEAKLELAQLFSEI